MYGEAIHVFGSEHSTDPAHPARRAARLRYRHHRLGEVPRMRRVPPEIDRLQQPHHPGLADQLDALFGQLSQALGLVRGRGQPTGGLLYSGNNFMRHQGTSGLNLRESQPAVSAATR
jgi:hypothetical protein